MSTLGYVVITVVVVGIIFVLVKFRRFSRDALLLLVAGILALIGVYAFSEWRRRRALEELEREQARLKEKERDLERLKAEDKLRMEEIAEAERRLAHEKEEAYRRFLKNAAESEERKREIDAMNAAQLAEEAKRMAEALRAAGPPAPEDSVGP